MACLAAMLVFGSAIYGIMAAQGNAKAWREAYARGEMTSFVFKDTRQPAGDISFKDEAGNDLTLENWKGRVVLLNLWATWCAPCRHEMPALDRLQAELGGDNFEVVALSVDRKGAAPSRQFLDEVDADHLALYVDKSTKAMFELRARGLPATLLIDRNGGLIGRLVGPAEWDSQDAKALIRAAIEGAFDAPTN